MTHMLPRNYLEQNLFTKILKSELDEGGLLHERMCFSFETKNVFTLSRLVKTRTKTFHKA